MQVSTYAEFQAWYGCARKARAQAFLARGRFPAMDPGAALEYKRLSGIVTTAAMLVPCRLEVVPSRYSQKMLEWRLHREGAALRDGKWPRDGLQTWHTDTLEEFLLRLAALDQPFGYARYHIFGPLICSPELRLSPEGVDGLADRVALELLFELEVPDVMEA